MRLESRTRASATNERRIWEPLQLDNLNDPQTASDRRSVFDLIRSVYNPILVTWIAEGGNPWQHMLRRRDIHKDILRQLTARAGELPPRLQSIESQHVLGEILIDILKYYRFTDPAWRVPAPLPSPLPPPPPAAPAAAAAAAAAAVATPSPRGEDETLDATADTLSPLEVLAEAASSVRPIPVLPTTSSLDILAAVASTRPYVRFPVPTPTPSPCPTPVDSPAPGTKRARNEKSEDESEQPAKKKQAVSPK
ncbi:hypothetical protein PENCOP_c006G05678 [Penicillium coprophilum]|uniref:Uncharacterized protein n=1 Tax=Penicillium coprophilum TaxID=36646 RepID=A0A1V6UNQ7_9EURO|nr:hypothetical protein PENCOP_c006G05678 [Penicillium coprophilum]